MSLQQGLHGGPVGERTRICWVSQRPFLEDLFSYSILGSGGQKGCWGRSDLAFTSTETVSGRRTGCLVHKDSHLCAHTGKRNVTCSAQLHLSHDPRPGPHCGSLGNCVADICMSKLTFFRGDGETLLKSGFGQRGHTFFFFFAALDLCWCVQVFSSCGERELLSRCFARVSHCHGFSSRKGRALEHGLSSCGAQV